MPDKNNFLHNCRNLIGNNLSENDLNCVECYVHNHIGIFIPSIGFCQYSIQKGHTHPSYMVIIAFDTEGKNDHRHFKASILSPSIPHEEISDYYKHYYCIMIEKDYFESQYLLYQSECPSFEWFPFLLCNDVLKSLNLFILESEKDMPNSTITLDAQEIILTHWIIRSILGENYDMRGISSDYDIARCQHYIEQHYSEKISIKTLCDLTCSSSSTLNRSFHKEMGMTIMSYVLLVRMEKAKMMLKRSEKTIIEIALGCGFGSSAHFSEVFGEKEHMTPSEYRKLYQS